MEDKNYEYNIDNCSTLIQIEKIIMEQKKEEEIKLIQNKRKREKTEICFDANKKKLTNCFCPNIDELKQFLEKCEIREIKNIDEIKNLKTSKNDIFDPDEFINKNYKNNNYKAILSIEDISLMNDILYESEDLSYNEDTIENPKENKFNDKNDFIENILKRDILYDEQKEELNKLILKIKKMDINTIIKEDKKLNIVFDLDNTCVYSIAIKPEEYELLKKKNENKEIQLFYFSKDEKNLFYSLVIREGLLDFFKFAKQFCNFHINTLSFEIYGKIIKNILEKKLDCKFIKFQAKDNQIGNKKFLESLRFDNKDTLIFDDFPIAWKKDSGNVIISKKFVDMEFVTYKIEKRIQGDIINKDYKNYYLEITFPYFHLKSQKNDYNEIKWKEQKLFYGRNCPFYYYENNKNNDFYSLENSDSKNYQFIYMKDIIKIIYYLLFNYGVTISDSIKLIRYNIFYKTNFNLTYYKNPFGDGEKILKYIIEICGGKIVNNKNNTKYKIFFVCRREDYSQFKDRLQKELIIYDNAKVVNDKFIIDSFFFMTNLESELENPDYSFNIKKEDDSYDY